MDGQEHIFIIAAGPAIHHTFPEAVRHLGTISHAFILASREVYESTPVSSPQHRTNIAVRNAVNKVKKTAMQLGIASTYFRIDEKSPTALRDVIVGIYDNHPNARFSFDLTSGSKDMALELFTLSFWLGGECYARKHFMPFQRLTVPKIPVRNLAQNPNCTSLLRIMARRSGSTKPGEAPQPVAFNRSYLFTQMDAAYVPGQTVKRQKASPKFQQTTLTFFLASLEDWGLVTEIPNTKNKKEKIYCITPDGELALKFFGDRAGKIL